MENKQSLIGHLACFTVYAIFGFNIVICKDLATSNLISPVALFCLRSVIAGSLFWITSLFCRKEKVDTKDLPRIFAASVLGFFLTQLTFLTGISSITPMDCSIIGAMTPIYTMFVAAWALKEPITLKKAGGVLLSFCGIIFLIFNSVKASGGATVTKPEGVFFILMNGLCFSLYLGMFKPLISKYKPITFMKWIFLFSIILSLPLAGNEILQLDYRSLPLWYIGGLGFLIFFATFTAYFLLPVGQKRIRPTLVSMYSYVQPIIAIAISIILGMDTLSWQKVLAAVMVFSGVVIVSYSKSAK